MLLSLASWLQGSLTVSALETTSTAWSSLQPSQGLEADQPPPAQHWMASLRETMTRRACWGPIVSRSLNQRPSNIETLPFHPQTLPSIRLKSEALTIRSVPKLSRSGPSVGQNSDQCTLPRMHCSRRGRPPPVREISCLQNLSMTHV